MVGVSCGNFEDLIDRMWSGAIAVVAPVSFKAEMGALNADYAGRQQQDAQEFMSWLLTSFMRI